MIDEPTDAEVTRLLHALELQEQATNISAWLRPRWWQLSAYIDWRRHWQPHNVFDQLWENLHMTGTLADELILAHLEAAGPSTTQEIAADLPTVGRGTYARLRSLHRRGKVGRLGPLPSGRSVLWFLISSPDPLPVFESPTSTDHDSVTFDPDDDRLRNLDTSWLDAVDH